MEKCVTISGCSGGGKSTLLSELHRRGHASSWVFFDRGLIDAAAALQHLTGEPVVQTLGNTYRYNRRVFITPPWPEIFVTDQERRHNLAEAVAEYDRLMEVYPSLGYEVFVLPKVSVEGRADYVLAALIAC